MVSVYQCERQEAGRNGRRWWSWGGDNGISIDNSELKTATRGYNLNTILHYKIKGLDSDAKWGCVFEKQGVHCLAQRRIRLIGTCSWRSFQFRGLRHLFRAKTKRAQVRAGVRAQVRACVTGCVLSPKQKRMVGKANFFDVPGN